MRREGKGGFLKPLLITAAVFTALMLIGIKAMAPVSWRHFSQERISALERKYAVSLEGTVPVRYWEPKNAQDINDRFTFCTDDYRRFMDSFSGEAIVKSAEQPDGSAAQYTCRVSGTQYFTVRFSLSGSSKGKYEGDLTSFTDAESRSDTSENTIKWEYN